MGDMCSNYTRQLIGHMRLRELFSPSDKRCGYGEARSGLEIKSRPKHDVTEGLMT